MIVYYISSAFLCTASTLSISVCVYGSQTVLAYSTSGRARVKYACSVILIEGIFRFLRRKPRVLFYYVLSSETWEIQPLSIPIELNCKHHRLFIIIIQCSGDISLNPGPIKYPCGKCYKPVAKNHRALFCEVGNQWWHIKCANGNTTRIQRFRTEQ